MNNTFKLFGLTHRNMTHLFPAKADDVNAIFTQNRGTFELWIFIPVYIRNLEPNQHPTRPSEQVLIGLFRPDFITSHQACITVAWRAPAPGAVGSGVPQNRGMPLPAQIHKSRRWP